MVLEICLPCLPPSLSHLLLRLRKWQGEARCRWPVPGEAEAPQGMLTGVDVSRLGTSRTHLAGWAPAVRLEAANPALRPLSPQAWGSCTRF